MIRAYNSIQNVTVSVASVRIALLFANKPSCTPILFPNKGGVTDPILKIDIR